MMNLFKRIISGCLVLCMLLGQFPVLAAAEETASGWGTPGGWATPGNWFEKSGTSSIFDQVPSFGGTSMFATARSGGPVSALTVGGVDALANPQGEGYSFDAETATLTLNGFRYENHEDTFGVYCEGDLTIVLQGENYIDVSVSEVGNSLGVYAMGALTIQGDPEGSDSLTVVADNQLAAILGETVSVENCDSISAAATALAVVGNSQLDISNSSVTAKTAPFEQYCELGMLEIFPAVGALGPVSINASTINVEAGLQGIYGQKIEIVGGSTVSSAAEAFPIHTEGNLDITGSKVHAINTSTEADLETYMECTGSNAFGAILAANTWYDSITITNSEVVAQALHVGISGMRITIDHSDVRTDSGYFGLVTADTISIIDSSVNIGEMFTLEKAMEYGVLAQMQVPPGAIGINDYDAVLSVSNSEITIPRGVYGMVGGRVVVETSTIEIGDSVAGIYGNVGTSLFNCPSISVGSSEAMGKAYVQAGGADIPAGIIAREGSIDITDCQNVTAEGFIGAVWSNGDSVNISKSNISADGGIFAMKNLSIADSIVQAYADRTKEDAMLGCMPVAMDGEASMSVIHSEVSASGSIAGLWNNDGVIEITDSTVELGTTWTAEETAEFNILGPGSAVSVSGNVVLKDAVTTKGETVGKYVWLDTECTTFLDNNGVPPVSVTIIPGETPDPEPTDPSEPQPTDPSEPQPTEPHKHSYSSEEFAPTCEEQGYTVYTCTCGDTYKDNYVDANGHNYINGTCAACGKDAPNVVASGTCGEKAQWKLDAEGTLTVYGEGAIYDYDSDTDVPWAEYRDEILAVVIEDGITVLGEHSFAYCENMATVSIAPTVETIQIRAFYIDPSLTSVTIPASVTYIGDNNFESCDNLTGIWVDSDNTAYCSDASGVLYNKDKTKLIQAPLQFSGNYVIPEGVEKIDDGAFNWCSGLEEVTIPGTVTTIGIGAFWECTSLTGIRVAEDNTAYSSDAQGALYNKDKTVLIQVPSQLEGSYRIADSTKKVMDSAFGKCVKLTSVTFPANVTEVDFAFYDCSSLGQVFFEGKAPTFHIYAFSDVTAVVYYPANDPTWTEEVRQNYNGNLTWIAYDPDAVFEPEVLDSGTFGETAQWKLYNDGTMIISGSGRIEDHDVPFASEGLVKTIVIEEGITEIGEYALSDFDSAHHISLPDSVTLIDNGAFDYCRSLLSLNISANVTSIYTGSAFTHCTQLTGIWVDEDNAYYTSDANGVLYNKNMTQVLKAPAKLAGEYVIPTGVTEIYDSAFFGCEKVTGITIPESVIRFHYSAFQGCKSLESLSIPKNVYNIYPYALDDLLSLTGIWVDEENTAFSSDENGVLFNKDKTVLLKAPASMPVSTYSVPQGTERIDNDAFENCANLRIVNIPDSVTELYMYVFNSCGKLKEVHFAGAAPSIGYAAFRNVTATAYYPANDPTWTEEVRQNYEGTITWVAYEPETPEQPDPSEPSEPKPTDPPESEIIASGTCGEDVNWTLDESGTLTISGNGKMYDYIFYEDGKQSPWHDYANTIQTVIVESGVTSIGDSAFEGCSNMVSISLPEGLVSIGEAALASCGQLRSVILPEGLTSIASAAFIGCDSLASILVPESVTTIGHTAFGNCDGLTSITLPKGLTSIESNTFAECWSLASITLPEGLTSIGSFVFQSCRSLTSITIPAGVTSIGNDAFYDCTGLKDVSILGDITTISNGMFRDCSSLTSINIPETVTILDNSAFIGCSSLRSVIIPEGVTTIGLATFQDCSSLTSIVIPKSVTKIDESAFYGCSNLTSVNIPEGIETIYRSTFVDCHSLSSITIPQSVIVIDSDAFSGCSSLTNLTLPEEILMIGPSSFADCSGLTKIYFTGNSFYIDETAFNNVVATAYYPADDETWTEDVFQNYGGTITWVAYEPEGPDQPDPSEPSEPQPTDPPESEIIASGTCGENANWKLDENGLLTIYGTGAMKDYHEMTVPWASHKASVKKVFVESGITEIGEYAFHGCENLTEVDIAETVTRIDNYAFQGCSSLTGITIPASVTEILHFVFDECNQLTGIWVEEGNSHYFSDENGALLQSWGPTLRCVPEGISGTYMIPEGTIRISNYAFSSCEKLTHVVLPESMEEIWGGAFRYCPNLESISKIPAAVTELDITAVFHCPKVDGYWVDEDNAVYSSDEYGVLFNKDKTEVLKALPILCGSYEIPTSVTHIGESAFSDCINLDAVTIPDSVTSIGSYAFIGCTGLETIAVPAEVTEIGEHAFSDCRNLTGIWVEESNPTYRSDASGVLFDIAQDRMIVAPGKLSGSYSIPEGTKSIERLAFMWCEHMTSLVIPESVVEIGEDAFNSCHGLEEVFFAGDAPVRTGYFTDLFTQFVMTAYYPYGNETWTEEERLSYGGDVTWKPWCVQEHIWNEGFVEKEPTQEETGICNFTCTICGATKTEEIPVLDHEHTYRSKVISPTCKETGYTLHTCSVCGDTYTSDEVPAHGCSFLEYHSDKNGTCIADGTKTAECDHGCGALDVIPEEGSVNPDNHTFGPWTEEGDKLSRRCTLCGHIETQIVTGGGNVDIVAPEQPDLDFDVDHVEDETDKRYILVQEAVSDAGETEQEVLKVFDINLEDEKGVHVQPNGTVKVKLPLDWEKETYYKVYRVEEDGTLTDMNATRQGSHMVFDTEHFSLYIVVKTEHEHDYKAEVTAPTCTKQGYTTHICALCEDSYVDTYTDATGHAYTDGICTNCGAYAVTIPAIEAAYDAEVQLWVYALIPDKMLASENAYVEMIKDSAFDGKVTTRVTAGQLRIQGKTSYGDYQLSQGMASGEMTKQVTYKFYDGKGNPVTILDENGREVGTEISYSIMDYVDRILQRGSEKQKNIVKYLVTYGGYAQNYFSKKFPNAALDAQNPAFNILNQYNLAIPSLNGVTADSITNAVTLKGENAGIQYNGAEGYLDSAIYLRSYFLLTGNTPIDSYDFVLTYADAAGRTRTMSLTPTAAGGEYYVDIPDIPAAYLDYDYVITITNNENGETYTVTTSILAWIKNGLAKFTNEDQKNMLKAMYLYNQAANQFFGK